MNNEYWARQQGALTIHFLCDTGSQQQQTEYYYTERWELPLLPMCIKMFCSIFNQSIYVLLGPKDGCQDLISQLTEPGTLTGKHGCACRIDDDRLCMWVGQDWRNLRKSDQSGTVNHEALHIVEAIMKHVGMKPHRENEELRAYMQNWIAESVLAICNAEPWDWQELGIDVKSIVRKTNEDIQTKTS